MPSNRKMLILLLILVAALAIGDYLNGRIKSDPQALMRLHAGGRLKGAKDSTFQYYQDDKGNCLKLASPMLAGNWLDPIDCAAVPAQVEWVRLDTSKG